MKVLFEDNHIIGVYKPHGVLVQDDATERTSLLVMVKEFLREKYQKPGNVFLGLVHRLDRQVAGVVVFAKTSKAAARLSEQIRNRAAKKTYCALVDGSLPEDGAGELLDFFVEEDGASRLAQASTPGAKEARLRYRVLSRRADSALLEIDLVTGRKHQIRLQFASRGCPIRGDFRYGSRLEYGKDALALICVRMEFLHPTQSLPLVIELPPELYPSLHR